MVEGTTLSEGRGTTRPLEMIGAPDLDMPRVFAEMRRLAPEWLRGAKIRLCHFEPTFHKHQGKLNHGFQIHVDDEDYRHTEFRPYRLVALWFKAIRQVHPEYPLWRDFKYEYESDRLAIDLINGSSCLREWVDDRGGTVADFEALCEPDERAWEKSRREFLLYPA
jgi:uncharacterized protein YbbC (DUF1343 family)